jgi:PhnB protein
MADVKPIPDGFPRVTPYLCVDGAGAAIDIYRSVLGATERMRMSAPGGKVGHAELQIGDSVIMLSDEYPDMGQRGEDPFGHRWNVATHVEDVPPDEIAKRAAEMMGG